MNVLIINYEYPPIGGGAGKVSQHLAVEFVKAGHHVSVLTSKYDELVGTSVEDKVKVYRCNASRKKIDRSSFSEMILFNIVAANQLSNVIRNDNIEVALVFFSIPCGPLGILLKKIYKIPFCISMHGLDVPGTEEKFDFVHDIVTSKLTEYVAFIESLLMQKGYENAKNEARVISAILDGIGFHALMMMEEYPLDEMEDYLINKYCNDE